MRVPDHVEHARTKENEGLAALFRDATDNLVGLVAAHFKLANLELVADLQARARQLVLQVLFGLVAFVGYALLVTGIALAAQQLMSLSLAFILLGGFHLAAAGIGAVVVARRRTRAFRVEKALYSVGTSVTTVADAVLGAPGQAHVRN